MEFCRVSGLSWLCQPRLPPLPKVLRIACRSREDCTSSSPILAYIQPSDSLSVRYGLAEADMDCYAVTVRIGGGCFRVIWWESTIRRLLNLNGGSESHVPAEVPAFEEPKPAIPGPAAPVKPPLPQSFAGMNYLDVRGRRIDLTAMKAPVVVLYFWSTRDPKSIRTRTVLVRVRAISWGWGGVRRCRLGSYGGIREADRRSTRGTLAADSRQRNHSKKVPGCARKTLLHSGSEAMCDCFFLFQHRNKRSAQLHLRESTRRFDEPANRSNG